MNNDFSLRNLKIPRRLFGRPGLSVSCLVANATLFGFVAGWPFFVLKPHRFLAATIT